MERYELVEKGQSNIKVTTNKVTGTTTLKVYKITGTGATPILTDISPANPTITSIASGAFKQYNLTAPNEDCYVLVLFNGIPQFFRVGVPTLRIFTYNGKTTPVVTYKLLTFAGVVSMQGNMTHLGIGIWYVTPNTTGDFIFSCSVGAPIPVHTPYVVDTVGMSGKIVFQKDKWMMLAVPKENAKISDLCAAMETKYGVSASTIFRIFNAYPATATQSDEMLDYKPNVTPNNTKYNFSLVYSDGTSKEITGFWCRTLNYTVNNNASELATYEWSSN